MFNVYLSSINYLIHPSRILISEIFAEVSVDHPKCSRLSRVRLTPYEAPECASLVVVSLHT